jgi:uncharacterized protein (DUF362 family)
MTGDHLNRRVFLRRMVANTTLAAGAVAAGFAFKGDRLPIEEESRAGSREDTLTQAVAPGKLAVAKGDDPSIITAQAVDALGGMGAFVSKGDRVLIKPNIGWDRRVKFAANTHPDVVAALARLCLEAGASKVVVTDSPCNNPVRCFDRSGVKKAVSGMNVELLIPTERDYVEIDLGGGFLKTWPVLKVLMDSDKIINAPIAKHHSSAVLTLGMKNWYGILGGGKRRGQLHQAMAQGIADLARFVKPHLTVLDANRILLRNGPQGGSIGDTEVRKTVAASSDPVAIDAFGATLFEMKPEEVPYIPMAAKLGLGTMDLDAVEKITLGG